MNEFVINPPRIFLAVIGGVLLVVVLSMFLKRGDTGRKLAALAITVVVLAVVTFLFYRPAVLTVDDSGISVRRFRVSDVSWTEVRSAERIMDLSSSPYRPTNRVVGVGLGAYKVGTFRLRDGSTARVTMEQDREVLLVSAEQQLYLFAVNDQEQLVAAVARYIEVE